MAFEMNDSYYRCLDELKNRYRGRGLAGSMKTEAARLAAKDEKAEKTSDGSRMFFDSRTGIADSYRSGTYNGSKYMTSDDFVRYFRNRREFYMPEALRKKQQEMAAKSAPQVARRHASSREMTDGEGNSKEGHLKNTISALIELGKKWFYIEPRRGRIEGKKLYFPVSALTGLAAFTVSLGLIVGGSVMIGSASGQVGQLNSEISALEAKQTDLEGKLDLKYDINQIEKDASELGMIKREHADNQYISIDVEDDVIVYGEDEEQNVGFMALLSAFGIELDK